MNRQQRSTNTPVTNPVSGITSWLNKVDMWDRKDQAKIINMFLESVKFQPSKKDLKPDQLKREQASFISQQFAKFKRFVFDNSMVQELA